MAPISKMLLHQINAWAFDDSHLFVYRYNYFNVNFGMILQPFSLIFCWLILSIGSCDWLVCGRRRVLSVDWLVSELWRRTLAAVPTAVRVTFHPGSLFLVDTSWTC